MDKNEFLEKLQKINNKLGNNLTQIMNNKTLINLTLDMALDGDIKDYPVYYDRINDCNNEIKKLENERDILMQEKETLKNNYYNTISQ